jgi:hypothetical protein
VNIPGATPRRRRTGQTQDWQATSWQFYDTVGEYRFAANWIGNALSRIELTVVQDTEHGRELLLEGPAVDALEALFDGDSGKSQMLQALGVHMTCAGESYLVGEPAGTHAEDDPNVDPDAVTEADRWVICSTDEIKPTRAGAWVIDRGDGTKHDVTPEAMVIRIWRPHPRRHLEADAPARALLPILREIEQLTKHIAATIDSRLAGAGILLLPSEMSFRSPAVPGQDVSAATEDPFLEALTEAMITPIDDRASAAAIVPIVVQAPGGLLGDAKLITFSTPFDEQAQEIRKESIERLARGLDMPPEIMLGTAQSNHWTAWQVQESTWQVHIEPLMELLCAALTEQYLWPMLDAQHLDHEGIYVGFNTAHLRTRPNKANEAISLYDRLELTGDALRRETGFDEGDKPTAEELHAILLKKVALSTAPELAAEAIEGLGYPLASTVSNGTHPDVKMLDGQDPPRADKDDTGRNEIPVRRAGTPSQVQKDGTPSEAAAIEHALLAACEVVVARAVERGRNRIVGKGAKAKPCPSEQLDAVLAGAWDGVPRIAQLTGQQPDALVSGLDQYTRALLTQDGVKHSPTVLMDVIRAYQRAVAREVTHA